MLSPWSVCDCPVMPRMTWYGPTGRIMRRYALTDDANPVGDAEAFLDSGAARFRVDCPVCGMVYASGRAPAAPR